jgi:glycosyltransferase involved in cell wall biosynthesis
MAEEIRVSVIIPFLDAASFFEEAIASVQAQTYGNWELLLVDDGSADGSADIARHHDGRDPGRVRQLAHPGNGHRGLSATRNLGIAHARGELVAFLDADDVWLPHKLERQVDILRRQPRAAMVYGASEYWHSWTDTAGAADTIIGPRRGPVRMFEPPELLVRFLEYRAPLPPMSSPVVRRTVAVSDGLEDEFTGLYEDQVFFAKICMKYPVCVTGECFDRYRRHPGSLSSDTRSASSQERARTVYRVWLEAWLRRNGCTDPGVWRAFRRNETRRGRLWRIWRRLQERLRS